MEKTLNETDTPPTNSYETDASAKIAVLRSIANDFALPEPRSLTPAERRLIGNTPRPFVEKAANFGGAVPVVVSAANGDLAGMRDGEAYTVAYERLMDEIEVLRQVVRKSIALRRLKNARHARSIYRIGKGYLLTDGGDDVRAHIDEMKKALNRRRRRAAPPAPQPEPSPS